jgi:hypothetical protein
MYWGKSSETMPKVTTSMTQDMQPMNQDMIAITSVMPTGTLVIPISTACPLGRFARYCTLLHSYTRRIK